MSEPQTIREYLADFNALEVGCAHEGAGRFGSKRLIFLEVVDHLSQAIERELRGGATRAVAEWRAIADFGSPEEVARSFEAGLAGALDKRLAVNTRRVSEWMTSHRLGGRCGQDGRLGAHLGVMAAVAAAVGAVNPLGSVLGLLTVGTLWLLWLSPRAPLLPGTTSCESVAPFVEHPRPPMLAMRTGAQ